jgi:hypothetical protein
VNNNHIFNKNMPNFWPFTPKMAKKVKKVQKSSKKPLQ